MMTPAEIQSKVTEIISKKFNVPVETITPATRLVDDLKIDSFGAVELMFELEDAFGLSIPDSDIQRVLCVKDIVVYLSEWLAKQAAGGNADTPKP